MCEYKKPLIIDSIFTENQALYGQNIASSPFRMKLSIFNKDDLSNSMSKFELNDCISGQILPYLIKIDFYDFSDVMISTLDSYE